MKTILKHGSTLDAATPAEVEAIVRAQHTQSKPSRIRATEMILLDGTGAAQDEVFTVPVGYEFEVRRVMMNLDTASDPSTGNVPLNLPGRLVAYQRSGTLIEYAAPLSPNAAAQIPGVQTWGAEQGPYLRNGEVFEVRAVGLTPNARLIVTVEGILSRPEPRR